MVIVKLDGVRLEVNPPDLDRDGEVGGVEHVTQRIPEGSTTNIVQPTELGDSLKHLNDDTLDTSTRMSGIDMRARLHYMEISSVLALDALVAMGVLPSRCLAFSRQKKRLSVSINGKGREEIVGIVAGKRDQDAKAGMMGSFGDKVKGFMGMQK